MGISDIFESDKSTIIFLIFGFALMAASGLFFGVLYYIMDTADTAFQNTDCDFTDNALFSTCQDAWDLAIYPFLALKSVLIYLSMFFILILTIGMLISGYNSGTKPYMLGVTLLINMGLTYASFWPANIYRQLLENTIIRNAMTNFSVYNKVMLNFPWFVFIISLFALAIGLVNWQRIRRNTPQGELDY